MRTKGAKNRNHGDRREEILRAACGLFIRDGFHAASMKDLCAAAGMSPGSVYRYFASKDAIITALIEADRARWLSAMDALPVELGLLPALRALAEQGLADLETRGFLSLWVETAAEASRNPVVARQLAASCRDCEARLAGIVERSQREGRIVSTTDPKLLTRLILAAFDGLLLRVAYDPSVDAREAAAGFLEFIGNAVGAQAPRKGGRR
jgi:AcrR family transcriptional regulator